MRHAASIAAAALLPWAAPVLAAAAEPTVPATPAALQLFERDWVLMNWALKYYDQDRDILLQPSEAQAAADAFRNLADADNDGRVTPYEFGAARAFIMARY